MKLRTITCIAIYRPERRRIVTGFRTMKELKEFYPAGVPVGCVVVKMKGHYVRPPSTRATPK